MDVHGPTVERSLVCIVAPTIDLLAVKAAVAAVEHAICRSRGSGAAARKSSFEVIAGSVVALSAAQRNDIGLWKQARDEKMLEHHA